MKVLLFLTLCLAPLSVNAAQLNGDWSMTSWGCDDGTPANDVFQMGRDTRTFRFNETNKTFEYRLQVRNSYVETSGTYRIDDDGAYGPTICLEISNVNSNEGSWQYEYSQYPETCMGYAQTSSNEIRFTELENDYPFTYSCPSAHARLSTFQRR